MNDEEHDLLEDEFDSHAELALDVEFDPSEVNEDFDDDFDDDFESETDEGYDTTGHDGEIV